MSWGGGHPFIYRVIFQTLHADISLEAQGPDLLAQGPGLLAQGPGLLAQGPGLLACYLMPWLRREIL